MQLIQRIDEPAFQEAHLAELLRSDKFTISNPSNQYGFPVSSAGAYPIDNFAEVCECGRHFGSVHWDHADSETILVHDHTSSEHSVGNCGVERNEAKDRQRAMDKNAAQLFQQLLLVPVSS